MQRELDAKVVGSKPLFAGLVEEFGPELVIRHASANGFPISLVTTAKEVLTIRESIVSELNPKKG